MAYNLALHIKLANHHGMNRNTLGAGGTITAAAAVRRTTVTVFHGAMVHLRRHLHLAMLLFCLAMVEHIDG